MAWIESHQELREHPKARKFARLLGTSMPAAIGHLHMLWWWAMDYADDGDLSRYDAEEIAYASGWEGDPVVLWQALCESDFVDGESWGTEGAVLHDWAAHTGRILDKKRRDAERKRQMRSVAPAEVFARDDYQCQRCGSSDDLTIDHVLPFSHGGTADPSNLQTLCRSCNSSKGAN